MTSALERLVWRRAQGICEYCRLPQVFDPLPFQLDHIIGRQHGGLTVEDNLALACLYCNQRKGPNIAGIDPRTGRLVRLFHPRRDKWYRHFEWRGPLLIGLTSMGRATIVVLAINHPQNVALRRALIESGEFGTQ